jgi:surface antigen
VDVQQLNRHERRRDVMKRFLVAVALTLAAGGAGAFPLMFLGNSVLQWLTPADAQMLSDALDAALSAEKEGTEQTWSNPSSGASGTVTFRRAFMRGDTPCRTLQIQTTAQAITGGGVFDFCQQANGAWTL